MRLFFATAFFLFASLVRAADRPEAIVLVAGDLHSAYDRTAQFLAGIDRVKTENPGVSLAILLDGDTFELGNAVARRSAGAIEFALFEALAQRAPTFLNIGNHEPEFFGLAETVARVRAAGVQVVGANVIDRATGIGFTSAAIPLKLGGHQAIIAGLTTDRLATFRVAVRPSLDIADPVVFAKQNLPDLLRGATIPILLTHTGVKVDRAILPLVPDGTLFAGAHDHLRFVHREGRTVYFHSGSWTDTLSIARLHMSKAGPQWDVEQVPIATDAPADEKMAALIQATMTKYLTSEETAIVGRTLRAFAPADAARFVVEAARRAAGADAAAIGGTTFGAGLPAGEVSRFALDACVRFDGTLFVCELNGVQLQKIVGQANQGPDTPFAERTGENLVMAAPATLDPEKRYHLVTTDWGVRNAKNYFGDVVLTFVERPEMKLKAAAIGALAPAK